MKSNVKKKNDKAKTHVLYPNTKVVVICGDGRKGPSFGRGAATLLRGVERFGSLSRAAKDLQMAYSKAWTMMGNIEKSFGVRLLERDGARGSVLTEDGIRLLELYEEYERDVCNHAEESFKKYFGEF